jgi:hypothetical protein
LAEIGFESGDTSSDGRENTGSYIVVPNKPGSERLDGHLRGLRHFYGQ